MGLSARQGLAVVALVGSTGFDLFNSTYIWPKLIAGALALICYLLIADDGDRFGPAAGAQTWVATGLCAGLALMCHGGVLFGMVPLLPAALRRARQARFRHVLLGCAVLAAIVLPWSAWQRLEEPPGNALVKFAFAGTWGFGEEGVSVWDTVRTAYLGVTFDEWLTQRWNAIRSLLGAYVDPLLNHVTQRAYGESVAGRSRLADFLFLFPSMRFLNLGWLAMALLAWRSSSGTTRDLKPWHLARIGLAGVAVTVIVLWRIHVIHTLSYMSVLLITVALATALIGITSTFARLAVAAQFAYFVTVWILDPLLGGPRLRWDIALAAAATLVLGWRLLHLAALVDEGPRPSTRR
jgi:hypothetical protein